MFLYDISAFMFHLIFYFFMNLVVFYAVFYNDITKVTMTSLIFWPIQLKFAQDSYVKFEIENFLIIGKFIEKIMINYENHVYCPVTLHLSPIPFGQPICVGFVKDTSFTYLRIIFQHKKTKKVFT